jgi:hypothetical protein
MAFGPNLVKVAGRREPIGIAPIYGGPTGSYHDAYIGDVYCYAPSEYAINPRGRRMWSVWTRNGRAAASYHKSEALALKAMRRTIRSYFARVAL